MDAYYFGLMLQVNRMADWSESKLGQTWGIHAQVHKLMTMSSINPYRSLAIYDDQRFLNPADPPQQTPIIVPDPTGAPVPQTATVIRASMGAQIGNSCPKERLCIVLELAENFNLASLTSIQETYSHLNMTFELQAEGQAAKPLAYYGITVVNNNRNLGLIFSLEEVFLAPGIEYLLKSTASPNLGPLQWILPEKISISR